jgi:hypothetical protein
VSVVAFVGPVRSPAVAWPPPEFLLSADTPGATNVFGVVVVGFGYVRIP